jgi:hypothetical protein
MIKISPDSSNLKKAVFMSSTRAMSTTRSIKDGQKTEHFSPHGSTRMRTMKRSVHFKQISMTSSPQALF